MVGALRTAICAVTGVRPGHIRQVPKLDKFQTHVINETLALLAAKGIRLPGIAIRWRRSNLIPLRNSIGPPCSSTWIAGD